MKAYDMKAMLNVFHYRLQRKVRSQRDYSAATRLEIMKYLEECLWEFEMLELPSRSMRCVGGKQLEHDTADVCICLDHNNHKKRYSVPAYVCQV